MKPLRVALLGNPNSGKTTLFNALTGACQQVGNWPGVTVECRQGQCICQERPIDFMDLPGLYSLLSSSDQSALDVRLTCNYLASGQAQVVINIVDASNLERNLYLTTQLLELGIPVIILLNKIDIANKKGIQIEVDALAKQFGCPVIESCANRGEGIDKLLSVLLTLDLQYQVKQQKQIPMSDIIKQTNIDLREILPNTDYVHDYEFLRLLEGDYDLWQKLTTEQKNIYQQYLRKAEYNCDESMDIIIADHRYGFIHNLCQQVIIKISVARRQFTEKIDGFILHRLLGIPIFLFVMYSMFLISINFGGVFQDFFAISSDTLFVHGAANGLQYLHAPHWVVAIVANGIGRGINTTITFVPVIFSMFLCLSFLEASGYMVRAAFVMDRLMRFMGLPGKSFVPMIIGFGCNVPAVMATRTLDNERDRILTTIMLPFMSCNARLVIFAVFVAAFFPFGGQNVVFSLYLIGIIAALFTGLILRKTLITGKTGPFIFELPPYHLPAWRTLFWQTWVRLRFFIFRAGKVIVPLCVMIGLLNALSFHGPNGNGGEHVLLSRLGKWLTPAFRPMGIHNDNWPATVGLLTGTIAKEVIIGTLNTLYSNLTHLNFLQGAQFGVWIHLKLAVLSIINNLRALPGTLLNPLFANTAASHVDMNIYGMMHQRFHDVYAAYAYLLFVLLYVPCVSTVITIARELNRYWVTFSVMWSIGLAYSVAVIYYQIVTFTQHVYNSLLWINGLLIFLLVTILCMYIYRRKWIYDTT